MDHPCTPVHLEYLIYMEYLIYLEYLISVGKDSAANRDLNTLRVENNIDEERINDR